MAVTAPPPAKTSGVSRSDTQPRASPGLNESIELQGSNISFWLPRAAKLEAFLLKIDQGRSLCMHHKDMSETVGRMMVKVIPPGSRSSHLSTPKRLTTHPRGYPTIHLSKSNLVLNPRCSYRSIADFTSNILGDFRHSSCGPRQGEANNIESSVAVNRCGSKFLVAHFHRVKDR